MIYLDLLFILNVWIDFLLLLTTNIILKHKVSYIKILIAAFIGGFLTFSIFVDNVCILTIIKIIGSIVMQLVANGYKGIKTLMEDVFYFYFVSIILAGSIYFFNIDNMSYLIYYLLLMFITPIILIIYKGKIKKLNTYYKSVYEVTVIYRKHKYKFNAYLDTGNKLYDQYKRRPISLVYTTKIKFDYKDGILVPIETANKSSLLKCVYCEKMIVGDKENTDVLIGLSQTKFNIQDIDMILHEEML